MNDQAIEDELEKILKHSSGISEQDEVFKPLFATFECHPVFKIKQNRFFDQKQLLLSLHYQIRNLIRIANERGTKNAIEWLYKIYSTNRTKIRFIAEVHGLNTHKVCRLNNGVELVPLNHLGDSINAKALIEQYKTFPTLSHQPMNPPILAVLTVDLTFSPQHSENSVFLDVIERSVRAFALVNDVAPIIGVKWIEFADDDLEQANYGRAWFYPVYEVSLSTCHPVDIDVAAVDWVNKYLLLNENVRKICDVAIERLSLARRKRSAGNKAIEGAICLEALLGNDGNQDLTYKLKLRSALLLETELSERKKISDAVKKFYSLRSSTVHGSLRTHSNAELIAKEGLEICSRVLQAIVERNEMPEPEDWELMGGVNVQ